MLKVPFKKTETVRFEPLKKAIIKIFDQDPAEFSQDFAELDALRKQVAIPQAHEDSAKAHLKFYFYNIRYYVQLCIMEPKLPFDSIDFTWSSAFGSKDYSILVFNKSNEQISWI
jgi:hypothetical protein